MGSLPRRASKRGNLLRYQAGQHPYSMLRPTLYVLEQEPQQVQKQNSTAKSRQKIKILPTIRATYSNKLLLAIYVSGRCIPEDLCSQKPPSRSIRACQFQFYSCPDLSDHDRPQRLTCLVLTFPSQRRIRASTLDQIQALNVSPIPFPQRLSLAISLYLSSYPPACVPICSPRSRSCAVHPTSLNPRLYRV